MGSNEQEARARAEAFRNDHGLGTLPIKDVFEMSHAATGIDVFSIEAGEEEHGLSMLDVDTGRQVIVVATTPHPMRQRSSVAHELGHLLRGDLDDPEPSPPGERSPAEISADAFARHLLLPLQAVHAKVRDAGGASLADLSDLVQEYEVSPAIAAIQLREAKRIDETTCGEWKKLSTRQLAVQFGWLNQYDALAEASSTPRAPQALMKRAVTGYQHGVLGLAELSAWYGQSEQNLRTELGDPPPTPVADDDWDIDAPLFPDRDGAAPA
jgi:Zn-dependent peptidase ImmA (M78 family)